MWVIASWSFDNWTNKKGTKGNSGGDSVANWLNPKRELPTLGFHPNRANVSDWDSNLSKVAVLGAGPCHLGGFCRVHWEPAVAPHIIGARQLIFFVGHAAIIGTAYIWCSAVQLWTHLRHWTTLLPGRWQSLRFAWALYSVMDLKSAKRKRSDGPDAKLSQQFGRPRRWKTTDSTVMVMRMCLSDAVTEKDDLLDTDSEWSFLDKSHTCWSETHLSLSNSSLFIIST